MTLHNGFWARRHLGFCVFCASMLAVGCDGEAGKGSDSDETTETSKAKTSKAETKKSAAVPQPIEFDETTFKALITSWKAESDRDKRATIEQQMLLVKDRPKVMLELAVHVVGAADTHDAKLEGGEADEAKKQLEHALGLLAILGRFGKDAAERLDWIATSTQNEVVKKAAKRHKDEGK